MVQRTNETTTIGQNFTNPIISMKFSKQLLIIILLLIVFCFNTMAQNNTHIKFMGVSMSGSFAIIKPKLEKLGFRYKGKQKENANMENFSGIFIGKNAELSVSVTPISKTVMCIQCTLQSNASIELTKIEYSNILESLITKYGDPTRSTDQKDGEILMDTMWELENGIIGISMTINKSCILIYLDKVNGMLGNTEDEKIIQSQL